MNLDAWLARLLRRAPAEDELVAVAQAADLRTPHEVRLVIDTQPLPGVTPRKRSYGDPAQDRVGTNRRPSHGAAWSVVKARADCWVDVGSRPVLRDRDVAGYPRIDRPP